MTPTSRLPEIDRTVSLEQLAEFAGRLDVVMSDLRETILAPKPRKQAPTFSSSQVAELCGIDRQRLNYLMSKPDLDLPLGVQQGTGRSRVFTLPETRQWVSSVARGFRKSPLLEGRPAQGKIIMIGQLKGGSTKTTTTLCLAQGLSLLRGRKVLVIDLDPQASMTEMCGFYAEKEITDDDTVLPYIQDPASVRLKDLVQPTYWDGIDAITAHPSLFAAEFYIPATLKADPSYEFWAQLQKGIEPLKAEYDYILLDTAPSLSYLTINALMAADALVMPLVPESLDFISSVAFWSLFSDITTTLRERGVQKSFDFISVLLSKVEYGPFASSSVVRNWAQRAYGDWLQPIEIPASTVMTAGSLSYTTVFDISKWEGSNKTLLRIREPLEEFCRWTDDQFSSNWKDLV